MFYLCWAAAFSSLELTTAETAPASILMSTVHMNFVMGMCDQPYSTAMGCVTSHTMGMCDQPYYGDV